MQTLASEEYRKAWLDNFLSDENVKRKKEHIKRREIYNKRQHDYVIEKLKKEFSSDTVKDMRTITSINIVKRITNEIAAIYNEPPERKFYHNDSVLVEGDAAIQLVNLYSTSRANEKLQRANRTKTYQDQCILQVVPVRSKGIIDIRVYHPDQVDCVPKEDDPESAFAYCIPTVIPKGDSKDDRNMMRFTWWSDEHSIITDGNGKIAQEDPSDILNPIGKLPFVDLAEGKENEFWLNVGNAVIDFAIDFAVILSDTANTNRLQAYSQAVMYSKEKPVELNVGPQNVLWIPIDENSTVQAKFEFATPSPDMAASLSFLDILANFFMTAEGIDPKTISSKAEGTKYASGYERFLAMLERYEASKDDLELFRHAEDKVYELLVAWSNAFQGTSGNWLRKELQIAVVPEESYVEAQFYQPELLQTKVEKEDSAIKLMEKGLKSKIMALMEIYDLDEDEATELAIKIEEQDKLLVQKPQPQPLPIENEVA